MLSSFNSSLVAAAMVTCIACKGRGNSYFHHRLISYMKKFTLFLLILFVGFTVQAADTLHLSSPDKQVNIKAWYNSGMYYQVFYNGNCIVMPSLLDMQLSDGKALSISDAVVSSNTKSI